MGACRTEKSAYERLRLSNGKLFVVSSRFWSDFLHGTAGVYHDKKFSLSFYFMAEDKMSSQTFGGAPLTPDEIKQLEAHAANEGWAHVRLVELDQFLNGELFNGMPDETMSSHWQRLADAGNPLAKAAVAVLDVLQKRHGQKAMAGDIARADKVKQTEEKSLGVDTHT